ncbi:hypothetical protein HEK616_64400 [Streptomyces nigrescens]|uniref:Integral membrane protein n=2 Tax=Streptomyces TaxID=1883 RepID=A0ABM8A2T4_STRNI|nr:hypothetical protein [Streptomyces nigrescens]MEE4424841.1 hypothetical protein [Streptomyces sp. DSM 41528]BDM72953.1 hypothetical protein HEK616_64400 [Streptomyces nigrescens]
MSDHQPQGHQPYQPHDPYAPQSPYAPQDPYGSQAPYGQPGPYAPQDAYGRPAPYGQPEPYQEQQYGGPDPYGQPAPQPATAPHDPQGAYGDPYGQPGHGHGRPGPEQPGHAAPLPAPQPAATATMAAAPPSLPAAPLKPNQRARLEGRSPIIPPGIQPAALTAVLALLLALTAPLAQPVLAVPVVLLQAVTAAGWFRLNGMWPARQGIALAFLAGLATDAALLATDPASAPLVGIGTLGVWCLLVLILQLRNRSSADERMYALTAGLTSTALAVLAAGHLAANPHAVVVGAAAVGVATLARALPLPSFVSVGISLVAAAGAGIAAGQLTGLGTSGALLGLAAGGCALIGLRVASYDYPSRFVHMTAGVALPLALAAPAVYVLGRALG